MLRPLNESLSYRNTGERMTIAQAKKLRPLKDKVIFAGQRFTFVRLFGSGIHLVIYDEPPSKHEDVVLILSCSLVKKKP